MTAPVRVTRMVDTLAVQHPLIWTGTPAPTGNVWLAERSGKPVIPFMLVPEGLDWRLWQGEPVAPTMEGVIEGITACIRRAPECWTRQIAMAWLNVPRCTCSGDVMARD